MIFIEILLSIHVLLLISSWFVGRQWLRHAPSVKLQLARLLLVSCILSPIAVHCVKQAEKPLILNFVALDTVQEYANQPILKTQKIVSQHHSSPFLKISDINYWQLLFFILFILALFRGYRLILDIRKLNLILHSAIPYRTSGRIVIKVSHHCHIPFSFRLFHKAYIILPVSLLSSYQNVKIAIAHEGQHHRNGDCLWAYFIEGLRIAFFGNPGVTRWQRTLTELQEFSCDEALVGHQKISAHDYGHCLFRVVQTVSQYSMSSNRELACTIGMASDSEKQESTFIIRRISMLPRYQANTSRHSKLGLMLAGVAIVVPICSAYAAMGSLSGSNSKAKTVDTSFLDPKIQSIAADEIAAAVKKYHAKSGVIAIADPSTGKILAFAEAGEVKGVKSWKSRVFSPGSTIKPFVAAAAIDSGITSESTRYDCRSPYYVDGKKFTNYNPNVGSISLTEALAKSVNVCLIKVAQDTGSAVFRKKLAGFGFDMNNWWQANQSEALQLANASLGESIPVTVETLTKTYAVLANKGHLSPPNSGNVISETTASSVTNMLEKAIENGTGKLAAVPGIPVAGKTGTLVENTPDANNSHLALFAGYIPAKAPRFVLVVVLEEGYTIQKGEKLSSGGEIAAPVFHNVAVKSLGISKS